MNAFLWVIQVFLASVFFYSGLMKATQSERKLVAMGQTGGEGLPLSFIRFIGIAELISVAGLILPVLLNIWPVLTPVATGRLLWTITRRRGMPCTRVSSGFRSKTPRCHTSKAKGSLLTSSMFFAKIKPALPWNLRIRGISPE